MRMLLVITMIFLFTGRTLAQSSLPLQHDSVNRLSLPGLRAPDDVLNLYKKDFASLTDTGHYAISWPSIALPKFSTKKPVQVNGGNISYYYDYRSNIDTPYTDKNVSQHNITGQLSTTLFNSIPVNTTFFIRRTNSSLFSNITDVRVEFDAAAYARMIRNNYLDQLQRGLPNMKDSLLKELKKINGTELASLMKRINDPDFQQKLVECNEIVRIPSIAESLVGSAKADSLRRTAKEFMDAYFALKGKEDMYHKRIDSLQTLVNTSVAKAKLIQDALTGKQIGLASPADVPSALEQQGVTVPSAIRHLLSIRRFSLGRSQLNASELTCRNLSINGINFEYNSWYYFAVAAGVVDYQFRDFLLSRDTRRPQYMYLVRAGLGRLEKNYFILSAYHGQKPLYLQNVGATVNSSLTVYGMSLESRFQVNKTNYLTAEIASSSTPGVTLYQGQKTYSFLNWKNKINKAYALKLYSYCPRTNSRVEAMYRYNGAAFQSFDRFQNNAARELWYVKAEQYFWKRQIKLTASVRNDEFSNPYIAIPYTSSGVSKSAQFTFRRKRWPIISLGYMPYSQLSVAGTQLYENRFQALNGVAFYAYKLASTQTSTTLTYNRFYNSAADTGFIYFNSVNIYAQQYFYFQHFTLSAGGSHSKSTVYELNTLEEFIQINATKKGSIALGLKIFNYNKTETKVGSWCRLSYRFMKTGTLQINYDNGLLPGNRRSLVRNQMCSVMLTKMF